MFNGAVVLILEDEYCNVFIFRYILIWNVRFLSVLPNKRVYELIYNRIGNDMLLWVPAYFTVKAGVVRLCYTYDVMTEG